MPASTNRSGTGLAANPGRPPPATIAHRKTTASRSRLEGWITAETAIEVEGGQVPASIYIFPNTRVPLVPPKPKEFLTAMPIFMSRAVLAQ